MLGTVLVSASQEGHSAVRNGPDKGSLMQIKG